MSFLFGQVSTDEQYLCDVFVIMPFRQEFLDVYTHIIKKVCDDLGLDVKLGDDFFSNRQIINEIWSALNNCRLVIADCTGRNANVFYELGIAHTLEKNTIILTKKKEDIPFDIQGLRYIEYMDTIQGSHILEQELKRAIERVLELDTSAPIDLDQSNIIQLLRKKDSQRFKLSLSTDTKLLRIETEKAQKLEEYDWMELFAEAWTRVDPGNERAYEDLGIALIR
jgi:hypothetical protein